MAVTKEQLQQLNNLAGQYGGANSQQFKDYVNTKLGAGGYDKIVSGLQQVKQTGIDNTQQNQPSLTDAIKSGNFTAEQAYKYNQMTGNNQGARDLALGSQQAVNNLQTTVTPEETVKMANAGINSVGEGVKPDLQGGTQEQFIDKTKELLPTTETTKVTTENTPTGTIKTTETPTGTPKIESIEQFKQAGGGLSNLEQLVENRYGTVATQNPDGSLTAEINGEKFKWTIDNAGNPIKQSLGKVETMTPDGIYNTLISGGQVDINTNGYTEAKNRFDSYSKYKDFTDKQFQTAFNEGLILPGTQLYNDLAKNPKIKLQMDKANALNRVNGEKIDTETIYKTQSEEIGNNTKVDIGGQTMSLSKAMEDGYISQSEYNQFTNTPEVVSKLQEVENLKNKADELQNIYDNIRTETENQLKGTGATKSDLESIVGEKQKNMLGNLNLAISKYKNALGTLTELKKTNSEMFATNLGLYQQQQQRNQQLQDLQSQREFDIYKTQLGQQYQQIQDIKNFEQQKEMLALQQEYQDRNIQTDMIQVGNKNVLINRKTGETIKSFDLPTEKVTQTQDWAKLSDGTLYNQRTGELKTVGATTPTTYTPTGNLSTFKQGNKTITLDSGAATSLQNVLSQVPNAIVGSTLRTSEEQQKLYNAYISGKGGLAAKPGTSLHEKGLAVDIYSGTDKNGKLLAPDENLIAKMNANGWFQTAGPTDKGHFEFKGTGGQATGKQYTDQQIGELSYLVELQEKNPTQASKDMKELGFTAKDLANYKAGNMPLTEKQKTTSVEVVNTIKDLITNYDWNDAVGKFDYSRVLGLQGAEDANVAINNLVAKLTLPNLGVLKGPMSDKDIDFIKQASSKLGTTQSNKSFEKNIIEAYNLSARRAGLPEVTTIDEIKSGTGTPTQTNTQQSTQYKANSGKVYNLNDYK